MTSYYVTICRKIPYYLFVYLFIYLILFKLQWHLEVLKSWNFGRQISHGCWEIAFCLVGYFNLSHPPCRHNMWRTDKNVVSVYTRWQGETDCWGCLAAVYGQGPTNLGAHILKSIYVLRFWTLLSCVIVYRHLQQFSFWSVRSSPGPHSCIEQPPRTFINPAM